MFLIQVQQILSELDMQTIQDELAEHLSEGQKRKLTFGVAILGDPRVSKIRHRKQGGCKRLRKSHALVPRTPTELLAIIAYPARTGYAYVYNDILQLFLFIVLHVTMWE